MRGCPGGAQVYPKMFLSGGSMYETAWWGALVKVWEVIVYNPVMDLQKCWQVGSSHPTSKLMSVPQQSGYHICIACDRIPLIFLHVLTSLMWCSL